MTNLDRLIANPPPERHEIGNKYGETCGRYPEPDEDQPRRYKPAPCMGEMLLRKEGAEYYKSTWAECDTCGEIGD